MVRILTPDELSAKLSRLSESQIPAIKEGMQAAVLNVEACARRNCTPGQSPYAKAPYSDDRDPHREPPHMRDTIEGTVVVEGTAVRGIVGTPKHYALPVHEGTSRMEARPFIMDAIKEKEEETRAILSKALEESLRRECV
ncbi:MAG: hypothetical protein M0R74_18710 [Dehalococcoidia bacterium]|nr:hypothetical protein [Dehalococcoidia bacterium]